MNNGDSDYLHITQHEGIPNIHGKMTAQYSNNGLNPLYAFSSDGYLGNNKRDSGSGSSSSGIGFTASSGERKMDGSYKNDVYGKSDHLTPYNSAIQIWRRIN